MCGCGSRACHRLGAMNCHPGIAFPPKSWVAWALSRGGRVIAALGSAVIRRDWGSAKLTRRHSSALVAVLACASLLATSHYAAARTTHGGKGSSATTAKAAGKTAKSGGKKAAARKSKDDKSASKSAVPQIPLAPGPTPQTSADEIAHVKNAIEALRHGGASKATEVAATISDPVARKLVEWTILRSDHSGGDSKRFLAFIAQGDTEAAKPLIREAWRNHKLSAELEKQVLERYSEFLTRADHKARMEKRVIASDNEAA